MLFPYSPPPLTSNITWNARSNDPWLRADNFVPTNRNGNGSFRIVATENTGTALRTGRITVSGDGVPSQDVTIRQTGSPTSLTISGNTWNPTATSASSTVTVTATGTWSVGVSNDAVSWLSVNNYIPTNQNGNGSFRLNATTNTGGERRGVVTVTSGSVRRAINVTQAGTNPTLLLNRTTWNPSSASSFITINVTADGVWNMPTSNSTSWLTVSNVTPTNRNGDGSFRINVATNTGNNERTGIITVTRSGTTQTIRVTQAVSPNSIGAATWTMYRNPFTQYEFAVTQNPVGSFGNYNNTYFGMTRDEQRGGLYAYANVAGTMDWRRVGTLSFTQGSGTLSVDGVDGDIGVFSTGSMIANLFGWAAFNYNTPPPQNLDGRLAIFYTSVHTLYFHHNYGVLQTPTPWTINYRPGTVTRVGYLPSSPSRPGYQFMGWFTAPTGGVRVTVDTNIDSGDRHFYAQWLSVVDVNIRLLHHRSFNDFFRDGSEAYAQGMIDRAVPVFLRRWGIRFTATHIEAERNLSVDSCPNGHFMRCNTDSTDSTPACPEFTDCGVNCGRRHKCGVQLIGNLYENNRTNSAFEVILLLFTFRSCASYASLGGHHATSYIMDERDTNHLDYINNVRTIQHEKSHLFGVEDSDFRNPTCVDRAIQSCLMNDGFDFVREFDQPSIWCRNCERQFDTRKFR